MNTRPDFDQRLLRAFHALDPEYMSMLVAHAEYLAGQAILERAKASQSRPILTLISSNNDTQSNRGAK